MFKHVPYQNKLPYDLACPHLEDAVTRFKAGRKKLFCPLNALEIQAPGQDPFILAQILDLCLNSKHRYTYNDKKEWAATYVWCTTHEGTFT